MWTTTSEKDSIQGCGILRWMSIAHAIQPGLFKTLARITSRRDWAFLWKRELWLRNSLFQYAKIYFEIITTNIPYRVTTNITATYGQIITALKQVAMSSEFLKLNFINENFNQKSRIVLFSTCKIFVTARR